MTNHEKLIAYQKDYPELTLDNQGYQYLSLKIQEERKKEIEEISKILKETVEGFRKFNNFKPRKNGSFDVRVQYAWDERFDGVGYFPINDFNESSND